MDGLLTGFGAIAAVIAVGMVLAHIRLVDESAQDLLARLAFFVTAPALMLVTISETEVGRLFSTDLLAIAAGFVVPGAVYVALARIVWRRNPGETIIGFMSATYVNAGNLGIPVASLVLGNAAHIAPTLLFQLLLIQPVCLALLDADVKGGVSIRRMVTRPLKNPLTLAGFAGAFLAVMHWRIPTAVAAPLELIGAMAVPSMLIAYGIALRLGPGLGRTGSVGELATTTLLKLIVQPAVAWAVAAGVLGVSGHALLVIVIASALPTAQNIFVHATHHDRATVLARDTILLTTLGAAPVIFAVAALLG